MPKLNRKTATLVAAILTAFGAGALVTYALMTGSGSDAHPNQGFKPEGLTVSGTVFHVDGDPLVTPTGQYQAQALIRMKPTPAGEPDGGSDLDEFEKFKASEVAWMRTRTFLSSVAEQHAVARLPIVALADDKARAIDQLLGMEWVSPNLLTVSMIGPDPNQLNELLTAFTQTYLVQHIKRTREDGSGELHELTLRLWELDNTIKQSRPDVAPLLAQKAKLVVEQQQAERKVMSLPVRVELAEGAISAAVSDVTSKFKVSLDTRKANGEAVRTTFEVGKGAKLYTNRWVEGAVPLLNARVEVKLKPWPSDTELLLEAAEIRVIENR